ncbi:HCNGP-like protein-domain-containing protein [Naematelia encephala]|uniref:HCNGP-like protein-domain-containing protein n=1 Tax=Naematelia encephala TaxID=71784 RepID=A0A1Y2B2Z1_9TREE|nr:HCNGP-like protein-domain-containing protein [Naematelia encephala]
MPRSPLRSSRVETSKPPSPPPRIRNNDHDSAAPSSSKSSLNDPVTSSTFPREQASRPPKEHSSSHTRDHPGQDPKSTSLRPSKRPRRSPSPTSATENLTHTAQSSLPATSLPSLSSASLPALGDLAEKSAEELDLTEDELFLRATRPPDMPGIDDWGIPPEVDPSEASPALTNKVQQFLRLKGAGQHVNTNLLASSAFANPHIYAKLVEFVDIDERATAFPSSGWLTRRNLEDLIPTYGPNALSEQQKARQEARKAAQEPGKRSEIKFAPGRKDDRERERDRERGKGREGKRDNGVARERVKGRREWDKGVGEKYKR